MRDAGLTHGGFYKHFGSKDELLMESLSEAFREMADRLTKVAEAARPGEAWKVLVRAYLSPEHCDHPEWGVLWRAPELARAERPMKGQILRELEQYKDRVLKFMPGRRAADKERAFFAIFSTMIGAVGLARILPDRSARAIVLASARDFLLGSF